MRTKIKIFIEGFIVGLGKIMPGVSGSVMAICLGVYERLITCLSSLKTMREDKTFLICITSGIVLAIIVGSNVIQLMLDRFFLVTMSSFIGMMLPGITSLFKNVQGKDLTFKRAMLAIFVFSSLVLLSIIKFTGGGTYNLGSFGNVISLFLCGIIDAAATIVPGISGSALLMMVGYYDMIIGALASPLENIFILSIFLLGLAVGMIAMSKLMTYLFSKHRTSTYILIITFAVFSILSLSFSLLKSVTNPIEFIGVVVFVAFGAKIASIFENMLS